MAKRLYQSKAGESLKSIAATQLGDESRWQELAYINSIEYPYMLKPGQLVLVPENGAPLAVQITEYGGRERRPAPVSSAALSPANWALLAVGAVLLWMLSR